MTEVMIKSGCYIGILILGFVLRRTGFFDEHAFPVLTKLVMNVTLPAALIANAAGRRIDFSLLSIILLGFFCSVIYMVLAYLLNRKRGRNQQAFEILNTPGYNIGTFSLPFTQSFLGPMGVLTTSLFDLGNAFICLGTAYGVAASVKEGRRFDLGRILNKLIHSIPFLAHILTVAMNLARLDFPAPVISFAQTIGGANPFLAMFMIGVGFDPHMDFTKIKTIGRVLTVRYSVAAALACCFYFLMPFPLEVRQALVILAVSPIGSVMPGFTAELKEDVGLSCTLVSLSILISIPLYLVLLVLI